MRKVRPAAPRIPLMVIALSMLLPACSNRPSATFEVVDGPGPKIGSLEHDRPDGARAGDTVSITLKGDPGLKASASLEALMPNLVLNEDRSHKGVYGASFTVQEGQTGTFGLSGKLYTGKKRFAALEGPSLTVLPMTPIGGAPGSIHEIGELQLMMKPIYFDLDSWDLSTDARNVLAGNVEILRAHGGFRLLIEGHCDERGTSDYNMVLGDRRANVAREFLISSGIDEGRIHTISYGEERPVEMGGTEEAWAKNRRCEFVLEN